MLSHHPVKENRRAWWNSLNFPTKRKRVIPYRRLSFFPRRLNLRLNPQFPSTRLDRSSGLWKVFKRVSNVRKRADIHRRRQWQSLCLGIYPCCCCQVVSISFSFSSSTFLTLISGLYLKENGSYIHFSVSALAHSCPPATEVPGTFRVNGSNRRMRELQAAFEMPPRVCFCPLSITFFNI